MILDTNGLSAMADGESALEELLQAAGEVIVPVIVLGEYRFGIAQSRDRSWYEQWLVEALTYCKMIPVDEETARFYAKIRLELKLAGHPIPANDIWIAALVRQYDLPLLSRDRHFDYVRGLRRISW